MAKSDSLIRIASFRWLWAGQSVSVLGSQISGLAFPVLAVTLLGATEMQMGLLNAADNAAFLLVGLLAGAWVDRWRKRRVMILADIVRLIAVGLIPVLYFTGHLEIWHLFITGAVIGVATVFFDVSYQSFIPILLPKDKIQSANAALETTVQVSSIGGPAVVGILLTIVKAPALMVIDALSFLFSAIALSFAKDAEQVAPKEDRRPLFTEIGEGLRFVVSQPMIRIIALTTAGTNFFGSMIWALTPLLFLRDLHISTAIYGLMFSIASIGGLLGGVAAPKLAKLMGEGPLITVSAVVSSASMLLIPFAASLPIAIFPVVITVAEFISSFTVLTYNITQVSARQRICPPQLLGRMNASIRAFIWGVMPLGSLIGGFLGSQFGVVPTIWFAAIGASFAGIAMLLSPMRHLKRLPDEANG
ncbi:MAG: MFS transporter [Rhodoluna sp.]